MTTNIHTYKIILTLGAGLAALYGLIILHVLLPSVHPSVVKQFHGTVN